MSEARDMFGVELETGDWVVCPRQMGRGQTLRPARVTGVEGNKVFLSRYRKQTRWENGQQVFLGWKHELNGHTIFPERTLFIPQENIPTELSQLANAQAEPDSSSKE